MVLTSMTRALVLSPVLSKQSNGGTHPFTELRRWVPEDQEFRFIISYTVNLRPAWAA